MGTYLNSSPVNSNLFCNFTNKIQYDENSGNQTGKKLVETRKTGVNMPVIALTSIGTLLPVLMTSKYQNKLPLKESFKKILKIEYGLKEMLFISLGSVLGGFAGGIIDDKGKNTKNKIKEGIFQYLNIALPTCFAAGLLALTHKTKNCNNNTGKIAAILTGVLGGIPIAAFTSNKINNSIFGNETNRKIRFKDCLIHVDDLVSAVVLAKVPFLDKLHVDKILPFIYATCGYETGIKE